MKHIIVLVLLGLTACTQKNVVVEQKILECKVNGEVAFTSDPWDYIYAEDDGMWSFYSKGSSRAGGAYKQLANAYCVVKELEYDG